MDWEKITEIAFTVIASAGGIGAIVIGVIKFGADKIADRVSQKYQYKLDSEIEKLKSELSKKEYVSKTRFDAEFSIYRELSLSFSELVKSVSFLIPIGLAKVPSDEDKRKEYEERNYKRTSEAFAKAQDALFSNMPFIPEDFFNGYYDLLKLAHLQTDAYERRFDVLYLVPQKEKEQYSMDDYKRTEELEEKWKKLNESIRNYLSKLETL